MILTFLESHFSNIHTNIKALTQWFLTEEDTSHNKQEIAVHNKVIIKNI